MGNQYKRVLSCGIICAMLVVNFTTAYGVETLGAEAQHAQETNITEEAIEIKDVEVQYDETNIIKEELEESTETEVENTETEEESTETEVESTETEEKSTETEEESTETKVESTETKVESTETKVESTKTEVESIDTEVDGIETVASQGLVNLALKQAIEAVAFKADGNNAIQGKKPASNFVDGDESTTFSSWSGTTGGSIIVTFSEAQTFNNIVFKQQEGQSVKDLELTIESSDDKASWTLVKMITTNGAVNDIDFQTTSSKYLKINFKVLNVNSGFNFTELYVHNKQEPHQENDNLASNASIQGMAQKANGSNAIQGSKPVTNLIDGDESTSFASWSAATQGEILLSFDEISTFNNIILKQLEGNSVKQLQLSVNVSNDQLNWRPIYSKVCGDSTINIVTEAVEAKYIKVAFVILNVGSGFNFKELEIYNKEGLVPPVAESNILTNKNITAISTLKDGSTVSHGAEVSVVNDGNEHTTSNTVDAIKRQFLFDLGADQTFNHLVIKQGTHLKALKAKVEISGDRNNWETISYGILESENQDLRFKTVTGRYVKITFDILPKGDSYNFSLSELELHHEERNESNNLARFASIIGSVIDHEGNDQVKRGSFISNLIDGDESRSLDTWSKGYKADLIIDLMDIETINRLMLIQGKYDRLLDINVHVSQDQSEWQPIKENYQTKENRIQIDFDEIDTRYIKVEFEVITSNGSYGFNMAEIEVLYIDPDNVIMVGNYLLQRLGVPNMPESNGLIHYSDRELLYDFDTEQPDLGVEVNNGKVNTSPKYYMTPNNSLLWQYEEEGSLIFDAGLTLKSINFDAASRYYRISLGVFQESLPTDGSKRAFRIDLLDKSNDVICTDVIYLHRKGWNILAMGLNIKDGQYIHKVRIQHEDGQVGEVYIDNLMIYFSNLSNDIPGSLNILQRDRKIDHAEDFPAMEHMTEEERQGMRIISERIVPTLDKVESISEGTMSGFRELYNKYSIEIVGDFANGENPLYYNRAVPGDYTVNSSNYFMYKQNSELCTAIGKMGKAYNSVMDPNQKAELKKMFLDLVRLTVTYGAMPNPWYNGRGYAEGIYYGKDILKEAGLLAEASILLKEQYGTDGILYTEHNFNTPPLLFSDISRTRFGEELTFNEEENSGDIPFLWHTTADSFNTEGSSIFLTVLVDEESPQKVRDMRRLKSWMDNIAMVYAPRGLGTLKPDGSIFHHGGNRFDNYGWISGWRGMTEYVYWLSKTPFAVDESTHKIMVHMAKVHFNLTTKDGYVGGPDLMSPMRSVGYLNLALAGNPEGTYEFDPTMASYWMAFDKDKSMSENKEVLKEFTNKGIEPAIAPLMNTTLSYGVQNIHQRDGWQVYTRGVSDDFYYNQYKRDGFLFYSIGGIELMEKGIKNGLLNVHGSNLGHKITDLTPGYNLSLAPGVTSIATDFSKLKQIYYQKGSSPFVGGLSLSNGNGLFTQIFDARENSKYKATAAKSLRFKKSYFYFGDNIISLASDVNHDGSEQIQTGLFQELMASSKDKIILAGDRELSESTFLETLDSSTTPWVINNTQSTGIYLFPDQEYKVKKGSQTFAKTGNIVSSWLENKNDTYSYIMKIRPTLQEMKILEESMSGDNPMYQVLQQDSSAHIVYSDPDKTTGYIIFDEEGITVQDKYVTKINKQSAVMVKELIPGKALVIGVSDPDMNNIKTSDNPLGYSQVEKVSITIHGKWRLKEQTYTDGIEPQHIQISRNEDTTTIVFDCIDGLTTEGLFENVDNSLENELVKQVDMLGTVINGVPYLSVKELTSKLDGSYTYNATEEKIKIQLLDHDITNKIGSSIMIINQENKLINSVFEKADDEILMPVSLLDLIEIDYSLSGSDVSIQIYKDQWKGWNQTPKPEKVALLDAIFINGQDLHVDLTNTNYYYTLQDGDNDIPDIHIDYSDEYLVQVIKPLTLPGAVQIIVQSKKTLSNSTVYNVYLTYSMEGVTVTASHTPQLENKASNTLDQNMKTYWTSDVDGSWIQYDLGDVQDLSGIAIAFSNGHKRSWIFDALVSEDGVNWTEVYSGRTSGLTKDFERVMFDEIASGRYIRLVGHGNTKSVWNSVCEVVILRTNNEVD